MSKPEFSDEFDFENRILDTSEIPEDNIEGDNPLRPKTLRSISDRKPQRKILRFLLRLQNQRRVA